MTILVNLFDLLLAKQHNNVLCRLCNLTNFKSTWYLFLSLGAKHWTCSYAINLFVSSLSSSGRSQDLFKTVILVNDLWVSWSLVCGQAVGKVPKYPTVSRICWKPRSNWERNSPAANWVVLCLQWSSCIDFLHNFLIFFTLIS